MFQKKLQKKIKFINSLNSFLKVGEKFIQFSKYLEMIRRKLTRLEVTLDDTKELDELFNSAKCHQINLLATNSVTATTSLNNSTNLSKLSANIQQKQLLLMGKDYESAHNITDTSLAKGNSSAVSDELPLLSTVKAIHRPGHDQ